MATTFKNLLNADVISNKTLLHEAIPITGTILSGTYSGNNIKNYSHDMFQSVYDYPYLSSSANHILDITMGFSSNSSLSASSPDSTTRQKKRINVYNEMAQVLAGYDVTGSIQNFDEDGNIAAGGTKIKEAIFLNFSRLLTKDEIKKGNFSMTVGASASYSPTGSVATEFRTTIAITDSNAENNYFVNSPAGEYAILYGSGSTMPASTKVGLLFYQAGVAVLSGGIFQTYGVNAAGTSGSMALTGASGATRASSNAFLTGATTDNFSDAIRNRIGNLSFNNTTELNSTIYFCRANHNEFNYSTNPTYLSGSKIVVKNNMQDNPVSYITAIGLYSPDNELLAIAKLSEPIKKDPTTELTFRVRLDY